MNRTHRRPAIAPTLALLVMGIAGCPEPPPNLPRNPVELLPSDNEVSGWSRSGTMQIAENSTQLFALIDGPGQIFVDHGFVKCAFQNYSGSVGGNPVILDLRIFDVDDTTNARAVYGAIAAGTETPWSGSHAGVEARIDDSPLTAYNLDFWDGRFYVWLTIADKANAALDVAKLFAMNVSQAIQDTAN